MKKTVNDIIKLIFLINRIKINNKPIAKFWVIGNQYVYHYLEYELGLQIHNLFFDREKFDITKNEDFNFLKKTKNLIKKFRYLLYLALIKDKKKKILLFSDFEHRTYEAEKYLKQNKFEYDRIALGIKHNNQFLSVPFSSEKKKRKIKITKIDKKIYNYISYNELIYLISHLDNFYQKALNQYFFSKKIISMFNYRLFVSWDHIQNVLGTYIALNEKKIKSLFIQHKIINSKIPGFINKGIKDQYKLKFNEYYYVWGDDFKKQLLNSNKSYNKVTFPNSEIKNKIRYNNNLKKKNIIYFFEAMSDFSKMNKILIKLQSFNFKIIIKLRKKNNEKLEFLLKNLNKKKLIIKKFLTKKDIKNSLLIICSRTSAFYEYLKYGKIVLGVKTDYYLLNNFEKNKTILAISYQDLLNMSRSNFINKIYKFNKYKKDNFKFYSFNIYFKKILQDVLNNNYI